MKLGGTKDIKHFVGRFIDSNKHRLSGKVVIDCPAGSGVSSEMLDKAGAKVEAFDLFPEFFKYYGVECKSADLESSLPVKDGHADYVLFQEGIEHLSDQLHVLREMNRVLKPGGRLLLTTPNYSNLRAKMSYMLNESEQYKLMPPNQIESIWFSNTQNQDRRFYFGHMFLIGIHRLKLLGILSGLRMVKIHHTRINHTSFLLLLLLYPLILFSTFRAYRRALRKNKNVPYEVRKKTFKDIFLLQINPKVLVDGHLFVEFEKFCELNEVVAQADLFNKHQDTNFDT